MLSDYFFSVTQTEHDIIFCIHKGIDICANQCYYLGCDRFLIPSHDSVTYN